MIKFFRQIRQSMINQNRTKKYLLYAIGEIILVVIGILIALQINNWNTNKKDIDKEYRYLIEIRENLNEDLQKIQDVLDKNRSKLQSIDSSFYYLSQMDKYPKLGKEFSQFLPIVTNYSLFEPTNVAFSNITSTGNIDIIRSDNLRKEISRYYSDNMLDGVQNQLIITSQSFLDNVAPKMINKSMLRYVTKKEFDVIALEEMEVHKDPKVLSGLFVMLNKTKEHNQLVNKMKTKIELLIEIIDKYIDES